MAKIDWLKVNGNMLPSPTDYKWELDDVSKTDATRVESGTMYKKKIGFVRAISIVWKNISTPVISEILQAITKNEYFTLTFLCPLEGGIVDMEVYVGNRIAPLYNKELDIWESLSVNFIERGISNI